MKVEKPKTTFWKTAGISIIFIIAGVILVLLGIHNYKVNHEINKQASAADTQDKEPIDRD
jgi:hypothetical protein